MTDLEKFFYDIVKSNPRLKNFIRNIYQSFFDLLPVERTVTKERMQFKDGYFFGFHDISPFSFDLTKILANELLIPLRMPQKNEGLNIGYFDFVNGEFGKYNILGTSYSWNYHKGCRLQWLKNNSVIFNTMTQGVLVSKIINIATKEETIIKYPIDSVSSDGKLATSFSYERLNNLMPGYGYPFCNDEAYNNKNAPHETGLFVVDLETNKQILLLDLHSLSIDVDPVGQYRHYVTHSEFSNDTRYISFLHRWVGNDTTKRVSRLVVYDRIRKTSFVLPTRGMVSHYVWNTQNEILAYCNVENTDAHILFTNLDSELKYQITTHELNSDGHQSFISNNLFITDTYPNRRRIAKLFKVNIETGRTEQIAKIYSPKKFQTKTFEKHIACDLHPRVSFDGNYICFDAAFSGKRSLCIMNS